MENKQRSKLDSYDRIKKFNNDNATVLSTLPIFPPDTISDYDHEKAIFDEAYQSISTALGVQANTTGITGDQADAVKSAMAAIIIKYALIASIKANRKGNASLAAALDHPVTYITRATKQEAIKYASTMCKAMSDNRYDANTNPTGILNNITSQNITDMSNAITAYQNIQAQPIATIQITKAIATDVLPSFIITADEAINNMYDILFSNFNDDPINGTLVNLFSAAMHVIPTGTHRTGIAATVTAIVPPATEATPIAGVTMYISELNKSAISDANGLINLQGIKAGTYNAVFSAANMITKTVSITVIKGHIIEVNVVLQHA